MAAVFAIVLLSGQSLIVAALVPVLTNLLASELDHLFARRPGSGGDEAGTRLVSLPALRLPRRIPLAGASPSESLVLIVAVVTLLGIGVVLVHDATYLGNVAPDRSHYFSDYLKHMGLGLVLLAITAKVRLRRIADFTDTALLLATVLTCLTFVSPFRVEVNGAGRWIDLAGLQIEPSMLLGLAVLLYVAQTVAARGSAKERGTGPVPVSAAVALAIFAICAQPDLGTAMVLGFVVTCMMLAGGSPARRVLRYYGGIAAFITWYALSAPWRREQLFAFLDPMAHAAGSGFQATQGFIAIGSGGLFGRGPGESVQRLLFLPEAQSDFISAILGEEFGVVGLIVLVGAYVALSYAGLRVARIAPDRYGSLVAAGATSWLICQALVHLFSVLSLAPLTGTALPFVSYGGTSLVVDLICVGLLLNVAREHRPPAEMKLRAISTLMRRRLGILFLTFLGLFALVLSRDVQIGVIRHAKYASMARAQQTAMLSVPAPRGVISDRNGTVLARSVPADDIVAAPAKITDSSRSAALLAKALGRPVAPIRRALAAQANIVWIASQIDPAVGLRLRRLNLWGVTVTPTYRRESPRGTSGAQVVGVVGPTGHGLSGVERRYDNVLRGTSGIRRDVLDAVGRTVQRHTLNRMVPGRDVRLSIDAGLQHQVDDVVQNAVHTTRSRVVSALVVDLGSGALLAGSSWPALDPNSPKQWTPAAIRNGSAQTTIEPRGLFAVFVRAAASQQRLIPVSAVTSSTRGIDAVADSLGAHRLDAWIRRFGFGVPSGIGIDEASGHVPRPEDYALGTMGQLSRGRGLTVTPLQMALGIGSLLRDGRPMRPSIVASDGRSSVTSAPPTPLLRPSVASAAKAAILKKAAGEPRGLAVESGALAVSVSWTPLDHPRYLTVAVSERRSGRGAVVRLARNVGSVAQRFLGR